MGKIHKILFLILFSVVSLLGGCTAEEKMSDEGLLSEIFGYAYEVTSTRNDPNQPWSSTTGILNLLLTGDTDGEAGKLTRVWSDFSEGSCPIGTTCFCSGKIVQSFIQVSKAEVNKGDTPYSIFDVIDEDEGNLTDDTNEKLKVYYVYIATLERVTSEYCRTEPDRTIAIYRFSNNDIIIVDGTYQVAMRKR